MEGDEILTLVPLQVNVSASTHMRVGSYVRVSTEMLLVTAVEEPEQDENSMLDEEENSTAVNSTLEEDEKSTVGTVNSTLWTLVTVVRARQGTQRAPHAAGVGPTP